MAKGRGKLLIVWDTWSVSQIYAMKPPFVRQDKPVRIFCPEFLEKLWYVYVCTRMLGWCQCFISPHTCSTFWWWKLRQGLHTYLSAVSMSAIGCRNWLRYCTVYSTIYSATSTIQQVVGTRQNTLTVESLDNQSYLLPITASHTGWSSQCYLGRLAWE